MAAPRKKPEPTPEVDPDLAAKLADLEPFEETDLTAHVEQVEKVASELGVSDLPRPPLLAFFDRIGLVKGAHLSEIRLLDGSRFGYSQILDIGGMAPDGDTPWDVVISIAESGVRGGRPTRIRYSAIASWSVQ